MHLARLETLNRKQLGAFTDDWNGWRNPGAGKQGSFKMFDPYMTGKAESASSFLADSLHPTASCGVHYLTTKTV